MSEVFWDGHAACLAGRGAEDDVSAVHNVQPVRGAALLQHGRALGRHLPRPQAVHQAAQSGRGQPAEQRHARQEVAMGRQLARVGGLRSQPGGMSLIFRKLMHFVRFTCI